MDNPLPVIYLVRHGETEWSRSGQHTGRTDIPLTPRGESAARALGEYLNRLKFAHVFSSPSQRAWRTCELAGFGGLAVRDPDLVEWDYGAYEGRLTADIKRERPDWQIFRDGCPGGESVADVTSRADRVVEKLRQLDGDILLFSSSHFLRALAVRWLGLDMIEGQHFILTTASISILGYDKSVDEPAMRLWNYDLTDFQSQS